MNGQEEQPRAQEPIVRVFADGRVVIGAGYSVGEILTAVEAARKAVLGIVLVPAVAPAGAPKQAAGKEAAG